LPERIAFLVGNQVFHPDSGLLPLQGPRNDVAALSRILRDPERGKFTVREFLDKPRHEILPEIERTLGRAMPGDLVLIYYSGHGKLDRNGRVCLATRDTEEGALQATSIPARHLTDLVNQSDCDQVVLMLDCCYSGAVDDLRGDVSSEMHVIEDARGFYILTASTDRQTARETEALLGAMVMGRFTAALVDGIESGAADTGRKGRVLLSDLRHHIGQVVVGQTPQFFARKATGDPLISLSPATATPLLDGNVLGDLTAESWHRRLGAVSYLLTTAQEGTPPARQAARAKLEQHLPSERDIEVRKRIEEGLIPPKLAASKPEPPRPSSARRNPKYIAFAAAAALILLAGGIAGLLRGPFDPGSKVVADQPSPIRRLPAMEPAADRDAPNPSARCGEDLPEPRDAVARSGTSLVTGTVNLLPGLNAAHVPPQISSIKWYVGTWTRHPPTSRGFQVIIDQTNEQNATIRIRCAESRSSSGQEIAVRLNFSNAVLTGPLFSSLDRFEPIDCPLSVGQNKQCLRQLTSENATYTYVRDDR
jgi:hypothetical protein